MTARLLAECPVKVDRVYTVKVETDPEFPRWQGRYSGRRMLVTWVLIEPPGRWGKDYTAVAHGYLDRARGGEHGFGIKPQL